MRDFLVLAAAAGVVIAAGLYMQRRNGAASTAPAGGRFVSGSPDAIINNALPGQIGYGWSYYTGGVAISPEGVYYKDGSEVWRP